jgi:hypothetical protein
LKALKKESHTDVIFSVLNDHSGKLVIAQLELKALKKESHTVVNHVESLNDHPGKLVNCQLLLK